jgi:hypothetical protein
LGSGSFTGRRPATVKEQLHPIIADSLALKIAEHLGAGLIVAALVASLFHLREFSEMFRDLP